MSPEDCNTLLAYVRKCVMAATEREAVPSLKSPSPTLRLKKATFITLRTEGVLRGCIGQIEATEALWKSAKNMSVAAATKDNRFPPLLSGEHFRVEISILSSPERISKEEIVLGKHGLIVEAFQKRGVLLPHVAIEHGWDQTTFLAQTIQKADLPQKITTSPDFILKAFHTYIVSEF